MLFNRISVNWVIPTNKLQNFASVIPGIVHHKNYERYNDKQNSLSLSLSMYFPQQKLNTVYIYASYQEFLRL